MTSSSATHTTGHAPVPEPFALIVCGVDGSEPALEAVRQAGALAGPNATVELVAISDEQATAERSLRRAAAELAHSPARVVTRAVDGHRVSKRLLEEAQDADLLVIGRNGHSRVGGVLLGSTATAVLHRAHLPILVAARPPAGRSFPGRIMVAAGGPSHPEDGVRLAALIAHRSGSDVDVLRADWAHRAKGRELSEAIVYLREVTGTEPVELIVGGAPHRIIPEYAERENASLVITGSRGLTGVRSVASVSERVAHACSCSVLVMHADD